eukprot:CAMPEP_0184120632 /NCGR_PEP_ID=MMETSP0974-20121125/22561_1 /TAXON_ID=483370 /ORGANISM="non described non described, Strain CCMP2097" /LENGTH=42 /DNA_ID= /DNA_START= /DNA_END= /DNA_ORIENTATION=
MRFTSPDRTRRTASTRRERPTSVSAGIGAAKISAPQRDAPGA